MITTEGDRIRFTGPSGYDVLPAASALHRLITRQGYSDITLDFSAATFLTPSFMVPLVTLARAYRSENADFEIIFPTETKAAKIIRNANWAHIISPERYESLEGLNKQHLSAVQYRNAQDHYRVVDQSLSFALQSTKGLDRNHLKALEWALNEVTDNVLNHAESPVGGILQMTAYPSKQVIEFYVCDAGLSIPRTLRVGRPELMDDVRALRAAVEEGVTRNKSTNQGNGLYGAFKCCEVSGGQFEILSGNVSLKHWPGTLNASRNNTYFRGTLVRARINIAFEKLLERALIFKGQPHDPSFDFVERLYQPEGDDINFVVKNELDALGSREAGKLARTKIENLMNNATIGILFDFDGVHLISSSFADEVFGRLFLEYGPVRFGQLVKFKNIDATVQRLIDRAIALRMRV